MDGTFHKSKTTKVPRVTFSQFFQQNLSFNKQEVSEKKENKALKAQFVLVVRHEATSVILFVTV